MNITKKCPITGTVNTRFIDVLPLQVECWQAGACIQDAMPSLSVDDREFMLSGITPEVWENYFAE